MKFTVPRRRRDGKLAQKRGKCRRRIADKVYFPVAGYRSRLRDQWRAALKERSKLEREAMWAAHPDQESLAELGRLGYPSYRLEEGEAFKVFSGLPTIWAILERNNPLYKRPVWADQRFGSN